MTDKPSISRAQADRRVEDAFAQHKRGKLDPAMQVYREVLATYPDHPAALHYLGLIAQQTGHSKQAEQLLRRSIAVDPSDARAHNHLGQVYIALNDKQAALACFERAVEVDPDHVDSINSLANVIRPRDLLKAIELYRRALALNPQAATAAFNLAGALKDDNAFDESQALFERTIAIDPKHCAARFSLGVLLEQKGRFDEAIEQYLAVHRIDPRHVSALANLIAIRDYVPDEQMVAGAEALLAGANVSSDDRVKLNHGLGKHYDRVAAYDRAFGHFTASNEILRKRAPDFDRTRVAKTFDTLMSVFSADFFAAATGRGSDSQRPVFIIGMPRSGTTLTEQILASHPKVFGAGELQDMPMIVKSLRPDYPEVVPRLDSDALTQLAETYLAGLTARAPAEAPRVTDKLPMNFLHLGLIATLFPGAHIVRCRRDPLDVGLSCFIELFETGYDYTTDLANFGHYFLQQERLMAHWRAVLPMPIHELRYEELVDQPEAATRALLAHCGLEWDAACLEFQKTERTVRTPSRWQVRQPIYRSSIGRWRHYEARMAPLVRVLEESGYRYEE